MSSCGHTALPREASPPWGCCLVLYTICIMAATSRTRLPVWGADSSPVWGNSGIFFAIWAKERHCACAGVRYQGLLISNQSRGRSPRAATTTRSTALVGPGGHPAQYNPNDWLFTPVFWGLSPYHLGLVYLAFSLVAVLHLLFTAVRACWCCSRPLAVRGLRSPAGSSPSPPRVSGGGGPALPRVGEVRGGEPITPADRRWLGLQQRLRAGVILDVRTAAVRRLQSHWHRFGIRLEAHPWARWVRQVYPTSARCTAWRPLPFRWWDGDHRTAPSVDPYFDWNTTHFSWP